MRTFKYAVLIQWIFINITVLPAQNQEPNILVIVAEDMRYDELGFLKKSTLNTPNLDKPAEKSLDFTNACTTSPICPASRAEIFTGLTVSEHAVVHAKSKMKKEIMAKSCPTSHKGEIKKQN